MMSTHAKKVFPFAQETSMEASLDVNGRCILKSCKASTYKIQIVLTEASKDESRLKLSI